MKKEEVVDIYDENKNKTGRTKIRYKDTIEADEYVVAVQAIILNSNKQILITQRSETKDKFPLKWECNGGALLSGEEVIDGLAREIYEEIGIELEKNKAVFFKTSKNKNRFKEIYLFQIDVEINALKFQDGEVISAKWVDIDEFMNMLNAGEIVSSVDFDDVDYTECLKLLNLSKD